MLLLLHDCFTAYGKYICENTQGLRSKFSELFIKTGIFPIVASDTIAILFDYRQEADYDIDAEITVEEAEAIIEKAGSFLKLAKDYFQQLENETSQTENQ